MEKPLVSVICLCYNHENYVEEAIQSVLSQTYEPLELIIVDDNSEDNSVRVIENAIIGKPEIRFIKNSNNIGNCKAFNLGFKASSGNFIIDHAADDILFPQRVEAGINTFMELDDDYGVNFCDAEIIDQKSKVIGPHYQRDENGKLMESIPQGDIYRELLRKYFIAAPTMMVKREVLEQLNGYDESLTYEDFDFWIRSARQFKYCFTDRILVGKRLVEGSLSKKQYVADSKHMESTLQVCKKAFKLNRNKEESQALNTRIKYELRQCLRVGNYSLGRKFAALLKENHAQLAYLFYSLLLKLKVKI